MKLKPNCECCDTDLPADRFGAVVCSFECTFCVDCAEGLLGYRCPNCGGELVSRPRRPAEVLEEHPGSTERFVKTHGCRKFQTEHEILRTATGELHASLLLPQGKPKAWVLLVSGSGPTDRDGNTAGQPKGSHCMRYLALGLAAQGIASLRYDKRGVGESAAAGGNEAVLTFDVYVEDAKAWLAALRLKATGPVSIIGHSEGAQIATRVAEKLSVASVVNVCGAGRPMDVLLLEQLKPRLSATLFKKAEELIAYLHDLSLHEDFRPKTKPKLLQRLQPKVDNTPSIPPELYSIFAPSKHPFWVSRLRERPDRELETLRCPVCIVSGSADIQISLNDYERLCQVKPDAKQLRISGMNHVLKDVGDDPQLQSRSYGDPALPVHGELIGQLVSFLLR